MTEAEYIAYTAQQAADVQAAAAAAAQSSESSSTSSSSSSATYNVNGVDMNEAEYNEYMASMFA